MIIGPHVHFRDLVQAYKESIAHGLHVAELAGYTAVMEMPNPNPPIIDRSTFLERRRLAKLANSVVKLFQYIGMTKDPEQVKQFVGLFHEFYEICGGKMFGCHSVGPLANKKRDEQFLVYRTLSDSDYRGVIATHSEKEELMHKFKFDPKRPITHNYDRPAEAEYESVREQIQMCDEAGFKGTLLIPHISTPEAVDMVYEAKGQYGFDVVSGTCPHYFLLDTTHLDDEKGLLRKMNPSLKSPERRKGMLERLMDNKIDWIETDHAPHTLEEKMNPPYMSGIPGIHKMPKVIRWLRENGATEEQITSWTFDRPNEVFNLGLEPRECDMKYDLEHKYEFDAYAGTGVIE